MYGGYAWLTNAVPARSRHRRLLLLGGMAGFLVVALAIPRRVRRQRRRLRARVPRGHRRPRRAVHARVGESAVRAILRIAPLNGFSALLILAGGIAGGTAQYVLWALALVLQH